MSAPRPSRARRRLLQFGGALAAGPWFAARARGETLPAIAALTEFLAGRAPRWERVHLTLPRLADNGLVVPMRVTVDGPFAAGAHVRAIRLYSEVNPVPEMAVFEFAQPLERIEVDSRVRLAATQRVVAAAEFNDGAVCVAMAEVEVTIAGCMDGT